MPRGPVTSFAHPEYTGSPELPDLDISRYVKEVYTHYLMRGDEGRKVDLDPEGRKGGRRLWLLCSPSTSSGAIYIPTDERQHPEQEGGAVLYQTE